jgi:hypothetical protein
MSMYLDCKCSDCCDNVQRSSQNVVVVESGIILPYGRCIFDSSRFGDLAHHVHVPEVDDVSQAANVGKVRE